MENADLSTLANEIIQNVGGTENIEGLNSCITRLRFYLKDDNLVNKEELESLDQVRTVIKGYDQYQVVIGEKVKEIYDIIISEHSVKPITRKPS